MYKKGDVVQLSEKGIRAFPPPYRSGGGRSKKPMMMCYDIIGLVKNGGFPIGGVTTFDPYHILVKRLHHETFSSWHVDFWRPVEQKQIDQLTEQDKELLKKLRSEICPE